MPFVLFVLAVACLWGGGQGLYTWATNPEPVSMDCSQYMAERPEGVWLDLRDCDLSSEDLAYTEGKRYSEIYVPVRAPDAEVGKPAPMVLKITDGAMIDRIWEPDSIGQLRHHDVKGLTRFGIELKQDEVDQVTGVLDVTDDFTLVKHGEKPEAGFSAFMSGLGLLFAGLFVRSVVRTDEEEPQDE